MLEPFSEFRAVAAPIDMANIDTGQIFPSRFLRKPISDGYRHYLFRDARFDAAGAERADFVMNQEHYRNARILVTGANFGCGSSREAAVHALMDAGFRCIVAPSYGDIFLSSCYRNGLLPVTLSAEETADLRRQLHESPGVTICVSLDEQHVEAPDGAIFRFDIDPERKVRLQRGLDECALALELLAEIERFEDRYRATFGWLRPS